MCRNIKKRRLRVLLQELRLHPGRQIMRLSATCALQHTEGDGSAGRRDLRR